MTKGFATWSLRGIGDKKFFWRRRVPPLDLKKLFVSDFDESQNSKSLWPKDSPREVWEESETKKFFGVEGSPLWTSKKFSSRILMKLKIWNPYDPRIHHRKFERNRKQKIFLVQKGPPFGPQKNFGLRFWWNSKFEILMTQEFAMWNLRGIRDKKFFWCRRVTPLDIY